MWQVSTTEILDRWFEDLGEDERIAIDAVVLLLREFGPRLGRPHADTLKGSRHSNLKELRASTATSELRIAFAFDPSRSAILLIGGDKSGVSQRLFYKKLIKTADALYDFHLRSMTKDNR